MYMVKNTFPANKQLRGLKSDGLPPQKLTTKKNFKWKTEMKEAYEQ